MIASAFIRDFERLKKTYVEIRDDHLVSNKKFAEDFNVFNILGLAYSEVRTHSAILREILDSNGTHGQGNIFFKGFLDMLVRKGILTDEISSFTNEAFDTYDCEAERAVAVGRIDLIIERLDGGLPFSFVIENKIYAADQEEQIARYWQELNRKSVPVGRKKIFYLTPDGYDPSTWSVDGELRRDLQIDGILHCLSYREDIKSWLNDSLCKIESEKVKIIIEQYLDILIKL